MASSAPVVRRPYTGSCHCGFIQYIAKITLPSDKSIPGEKLDLSTVSKIFKCNCTVCTKYGFFHCHLNKPAEDFVILSPIPDQDANVEGLGNYKTATKMASLTFCKNCGVRPFTIVGKGETVELDVGEWRGEGPEGKKTTVWKLQKDAFLLTVNLVTIDQDQGLDLRELVENKWVGYIDIHEPRTGLPIPDYGRPYEGGMY